jgi:hypothetical protein
MRLDESIDRLSDDTRVGSDESGLFVQFPEGTTFRRLALLGFATRHGPGSVAVMSEPAAKQDSPLADDQYPDAGLLLHGFDPVADMDLAAVQ